MITKNQSLEDLIRSKQEGLTKREKMIAEYFLNHPNDIAFISIQELSERLSVGRASILRFTQKLGYNGFLALKNDVKRNVQTTIAPLENFRLKLKKIDTDISSITEIAKNEVQNINDTVNNFDTNNFNKAIKILSKAEIIYTTGYNLSSYLAGITSYLFQRIGLKTFPTNLGGRSVNEQLININSRDVLIAFSFPPYSEETIKAAKFAIKQKCKVIGFTNSLIAPINQYSNVVLEVKTDSNLFSNSFSSALVYIESLANEMVVHNKVRFTKTVQKKNTKM